MPRRIIIGNGPRPLHWGTWLGDEEREELRALLVVTLNEAGYMPDEQADAVLKALGVPETPQAI